MYSKKDDPKRPQKVAGRMFDIIELRLLLQKTCSYRHRAACFKCICSLFCVFIAPLYIYSILYFNLTLFTFFCSPIYIRRYFCPFYVFPPAVFAFSSFPPSPFLFFFSGTMQLDYNGRLSLTQFEKLVQPLVDRMDAPVLKALEEAGVTKEQLGSVEIVGGSTRCVVFMKKA